MGDDEHVRRLAWGLDLSNPDVTAQAEIDEFRRISEQQLGIQQPGLDYWLDERPDVLKRYRLWADKIGIHEGKGPDAFSAAGLSIFINYARHGFRDGVKYCILGFNHALTKAELLEVFALAFRYVGPRGMALIAEVARAHVWIEPTRPARWPEGWAPDPEAFRSGVDFSTPAFSAADRKLVEDWYLRYLGEVPGHVKLLADHRPEMLKSYRSRFENTLRLLPKQVEPIVLLETSIEQNFEGGIREGILMARGFGVAKADVLESISWATFYGTVPALDAAESIAGDLLERWDQTVAAATG